MTTTESTSTDTTETASDEIDPTVAVPELGELLMVDPAQLRIGASTRRDVVLDAHFCLDVAERGVREPIIVRRDSEGLFCVRKGQRRTMAACRAGLALVRVLVEPTPEAGEDDTAGQVERIVDQYGENFHRAQISASDEAHAHQQLLDLGLTAGQIARRTHTPTKRVRAINAVNRSDAAREALASYPLTIDQAAVIAELDDGTDTGQEAAALLCQTATTEPEQFGHHAQRLRDDRTERELIAGHVRTLTEQGITVLTTEQIVDATELYRLRPTAGDPSGTQLRPEEHISCPGHAVYVTVRRHWRNEPSEVHTEYYCTGPADHAPRYDTTTVGGGRDAATGELTEEQKTERRQERARVITNNRAWESAQTHRRTWVAEFLTRKKPPVDAAAFIASTLASGSHDVRKAMESGHPTACALLGLPEPAPLYSNGPRPLVELAKTATGARATQLSLAVLLGGYEDGTSRNSWRSATAETVAYFTALRDWHYPLSEVERLVLEPDTEDRAGGDEADLVGEHTDDDSDDGEASEDDSVDGVEVEPDSALELVQTLSEEPLE